MIIGIDEVGRGCWAGPMVAAAVMLKEDFLIPEDPNLRLNDSKKLNRTQRENIDEYIRETAELGVGWVWPEEIDTLGLSEANALAMTRAIEQIDHQQSDKIIIDGNINYLQSRLCKTSSSWDYQNSDYPCNKDNPCKICGKIEVVVGADASVVSVSAASIVAKVARDNYMYEQSELFPHYGFEKHVGYGTKLHLEMLQIYGVTPLHRQSYKPIKALL